MNARSFSAWNEDGRFLRWLRGESDGVVITPCYATTAACVDVCVYATHEEFVVLCIHTDQYAV